MTSIPFDDKFDPVAFVSALSAWSQDQIDTAPNPNHDCDPGDCTDAED